MPRPARPKIPDSVRQASSTFHYHTFPTRPPASRGKPPRRLTRADDTLSTTSSSRRRNSGKNETPLPKAQLAVLAVIALAEQTALNSISPYLPVMASTFPEVNDPEDVGFYVGLIASSFAMAQFATNLFWGWLSDHIGRKPVILMGTLLTAACFVAFGFCRNLSQAIVVQVLMGLFNGNQGIVSTCLGEITDRSNQGRAFTYLPVVYGIGAVSGPVVGGVLARSVEPGEVIQGYPFLWPNIFSAAVLVIDFVIAAMFLEESLAGAPEADLKPASLPSFITRFLPGKSDETPANVATTTPLIASPRSDGTRLSESQTIPHKDIFTRNTVLLLITFLIFQLANVSYMSLYPIFGQAAPPTGRNLSSREIGLSLAFAGLLTIIFQVSIYGKLLEVMGNKATYRLSLGLMTFAIFLMPWVGYKGDTGGAKLVGIGHGPVWMWTTLGVDLVIKSVASVGGLTSSLILITNSSPDNSVLGTLNGLAQTLSAAGRALGPFVSGGLFSLASRVQPKGEALAFGTFGGITFLGFLLSWGIRGGRLEEDLDHDFDQGAEGSAEEESLLRSR